MKAAKEERLAARQMLVSNGTGSKSSAGKAVLCVFEVRRDELTQRHGETPSRIEEATRWGKQVLRDVLILRQHPQHRGLEGRLDNFDLELNGEEVMTKRDVAVRQLSNKRVRSNQQCVPRAPVADDEDPALMTFPDEEATDKYDPFELGFNPLEERAGTYEQEADTGGSSSSGAAAAELVEGTFPAAVLTEVQRERIAKNKRCAAEKEEAEKTSNLAKRKTALEKETGTGRCWCSCQRAARRPKIRGGPAFSEAKIEESLPAESRLLRTPLWKEPAKLQSTAVEERRKTLRRDSCLPPSPKTKNSTTGSLSANTNELGRWLGVWKVLCSPLTGK